MTQERCANVEWIFGEGPDDPVFDQIKAERKRRQPEGANGRYLIRVLLSSIDELWDGESPLTQAQSLEVLDIIGQSVLVLKRMAAHDMAYSEYLKSEHWKALRAAAKRDAHFTCQVCGATETTLHVHHRSYDHLGDFIRERRDVLVLCGDCHQHHHKREAS